MANGNVTTGDKNKRTTVRYDFDKDESGDKWLPPNGKEYTQSDEGGTHEAISLDDIQSFAEFSRKPCKEDCYYSSTKSEYTQSDEGGTFEAISMDDIQSFAEFSHQPCKEDCYYSSTKSDKVEKPLASKRKWHAELYDIMKQHGPKKAEEYITNHLNRWKTEKIKFAVMGQTATGKSTFINTCRGIKMGDPTFAVVGLGNRTNIISEYKHPVNENIIFCDLPGLSDKFTKEDFLEMVDFQEYSYVFIFLSMPLLQPDKWLMNHIERKNIPFCVVRSKIDEAVNSAYGKSVGIKQVMTYIRKDIYDSIAQSKSVEVFLISSEKPYIGEMSKLHAHMENRLPSSKFSAMILSFPVLTKSVIDSKILELKKRMPYTSYGSAIIASIINPIMNISISMALVKREVRRYVTVLGLDKTHDENIEGLTHDFSNEEFVDEFVESVFTTMYNAERKEYIPIVGAIIVGHKTKKTVDEFLSYALSKLKQDAITVYMHFLNKGSR